MANIINALTSGVGGVDIVSVDTSGDLNIQSGGSTKIAVTSAGVAVTGTLSASGGFAGNADTATTATSLTTASGSAPSYSARAWVNFNGIGTVAIRASGNVSSITDNGVGNFTINFTNAMPDANYTLAGNPVSYEASNAFIQMAIAGSSSGTVITLKTTTQLRIILAVNTTNYDVVDNNVAIFR